MSNSRSPKFATFKSMNSTVFFRELDSLSEIRDGWEQTAYKTANDGLYDLLSKVYQVYEDAFINASPESKATLKTGLETKLKSLGQRIMSGTTVLGLLIRYVFKSDRKRNSRYLNAIQAAKSHGKSPSELAEWLRIHGGIDEVVKQTKVNDQAEQKKAALQAELNALDDAMCLCEIEPLARLELAGYKTKEPAVLITRPAGNGVFKVVAVVEPLTEGILKLLMRQQAAKNLQDKTSAAVLKKEAAAFIAGSPSNDQHALKAA
jgi:hypothetical protein